MTHLLIGSSNVARFYVAGSFKNYREYNMIKCTNYDSFVVHMENLSPINKSVLISVVENFLADKVGDRESEVDQLVDESVRGFLTTISEAAVRLPDTRFGVVLPLGRPALRWYHGRVGEITSFISSGLNHLTSDSKIGNLMKIDCIPSASQQFEQDQIHLTPASGKLFLTEMLSVSEVFFESGKRPNDDDAEGTDTGARLSLENRLLSIERRLSNQEKLNFENNLSLARIREELDTAANVKREDRLVITGIKSSDPLPTEGRLRVAALKKIATDIFETLIPAFQGKIAFVNLGKGKTQSIPMMEVKLDSVENAGAIRKAFADKRSKKELPESWSNLFITNSVNLATRVRIDLMKSIARKITNKSELAYVSGFISRPMLHIKAAPVVANSRPLRSFTFIDAVSKFGRLLRFEDLDAAYSRVGNAFEGQVAQNFVVMNNQDHDSFRTGASGGSFGSGAPPGGSRSGSGSSSRAGAHAGGRGGGASHRGDRAKGGSKRFGEEMNGQKDKHRKN
jgi:hypothetical protein